MSILAVALFALVPQAKTQAAEGGFAGWWMTNWGPLELVGKGKTLSGAFGWGRDGKVEGKLDGKTLEVEWSNDNGRGQASLVLWKDGATFTGESVYGQGQKEFWGGYRIERKKAEPRAGEISDGQTELHLNYHLRVPFDYDPSKRYTALALFHGSNTNSRDYVEGFPQNWPAQGERYILVGFDGENLSPASRDGQRAFNSSYVNFGGPKMGPPFAYMQTPALVAAALEELNKELPIERWYVGGHSQGAFLTYAVAMFYPELVRGAFPVAGGLLVQCDWQEFSDEKVCAAQRRIPFAIVHGEKDQSVEFGMSTSSRDTFEDGGFPMVRLFSDPRLGHPWAFLPVDDAIDWLEQLNGTDPAAQLAFAEKAIEEERWRDATAALGRARELRADAARVAELETRIDAAAEPELAKLSKALAAPKDDSWVDDFWDFRSRFAFAPSAAKVMDTYARLRDKHEKPASNFFRKARSEEDPKKKRELSREIVTRYYASSYYRIAKRWAE